MKNTERALLSGNEAVACAALDAGVHLGVGYPGTPSTEILENYSELGGRAEWAPNEKVALEVGLGFSFGGRRTLVTMKHVGVNVAADPLFTAAYTILGGGLVLISADDPGMASSQNEQDNRRYAIAAGVPMIEPSDSQEAYDYTRRAFALAEEFRMPVILRMTTRICHSKTIVQRRAPEAGPEAGAYKRDVQGRVMIPAFARGAHKRMRNTLERVAEWAEDCDLNVETGSGSELGIVSNGVAAVHAREAAPGARHLKIGISHPLPMERIRRFAASVDRCVVIEEGDPVMVDALRAAGVEAEGKPAMFRFGELNVERVRRILERDETPEPAPPKGKPPALCQGCPHRRAFEALRNQNCIVSGDIGCYTLGVLPPFEAMDTCVCMGASIGVGLGMRHALPEEEARRVVSVIGDSTFVHSGLTGLAEMVYNRPSTGHVVMILDNRTTAMTGMQEHPGTGRALDHSPAPQVDFEEVARGLGVERVVVLDPVPKTEGVEEVLREALDSGQTTVIISRQPCILAARKEKQYTAPHGGPQ
jgi:indolepyruvate ferredoxin oxidoreductase alpha subunit